MLRDNEKATHSGTAINDASASKLPPALILDAVQDESGGRWYRCGHENASLWISLTDVQSDFSSILKRFGNKGIPLATSAARTAFQTEIQNRTEFANGVVATQPGWTGGSYVFGDGTVQQSEKSDRQEVLVVFNSEPKFTPKGELNDLNKRLRPLIVGQRLPLAVLAFAFVGPLIKFAPSHVAENAMLELSGPKQAGKSTLAIMAMSMWAGEQGSSVGGGNTWNTTEGSIDEHKRSHSDGLLLFDEGSLDQTGGELTLKAIWQISSSSSRRRMHDDRLPPIRLAFLSTTNVPLNDLAHGHKEKYEAMLSRVVTLNVSKSAKFGVFTSVPKNRADSREAIRDLKAVVTDIHGVASRQFVRFLVEKVAKDGGEGLRAIIKRDLDAFALASGAGAQSDDRIANTFGLMYAAARLAKEAGVLPKAWRGIRRHLVRLYEERTTANAQALDAIEKYLADKQATIARALPSKKLSKTAFEGAAGFIRQGRNGKQLLVPAGVLRREIPDSDVVLATLKKMGKLDCEADKYTKPTPKNICDTGKVYIIKIEGF